ncbi:glycosyltransferase family 1 protein [Arthrobacter sp. EPSL27]|uniref:glycosyltransferase family 1 protein n=1 Tax=Arthrobacter sp. EPSL27 TaxID=1745378 RepID=UPI0007467DBD|nr:glycosyltransferase family 1 protein [Arthrobacter sp. EPSL27]KUM39348.1 glycosyl transferase group 1 [Arthrobacter sp. EPSL27]
MGNALTGLAMRLRRDGAGDVFRWGTRRMAQKLGERLCWDDLDLPLRPEDIADPAAMSRPAVRAVRDSGLRVGWVCTPPGAGSGGHTTFFRMVEGVERRGHSCTLFLYDVNSDDVTRHEEVIRRFWPGMKADIRSATPHIDGVDAVVASSWTTAHVVASRVALATHRFYFVQDYEPYFYPRGSLYTLAEHSYHLGLGMIALGDMVASRLQQESGIVAAVTVPFGCDTDVYRLLEVPARSEPRRGVVFYAKRNTDRRGYLLAKLALERFHRMHPDEEIHVYGDRVDNWPIPVTNHGSLPPADLNRLYNRTRAGLVMSFTNISLAAEELLAAGCTPVLNDSDLARADLPAHGAVWASPTPAALASALSALVAGPAETAGSPRVRAGWGRTQALVADYIESACMGA